MAYTVAELISLNGESIRNLPYDELVKAERRAAQLVNRRISILQQKGLTDYSPAYHSIVASFSEGGIPVESLKGKLNRARTMYELRRARDFLTSVTATVKGARKYGKNMERLVGSSDPDFIKKFWQTIDQLRDDQPLLWGRISSTRAINVAVQTFIHRYKVSTNVKRIERALRQFEQDYFNI